MPYEIYLGGLRFPIPPSKIQMKVKGQNKTMNLINGEEINILNPAGLTEITLDALLPIRRYPFASYEDGFEPPEYFLDAFEQMKNEKTPIQFIVIREGPGRSSFFDTNQKVSLEDYDITEDAEEGGDITVSLSLKVYQDYGIAVIPLPQEPGEEITAAPTEERSAETAPSPKVYTVVRGDCLWAIAKRILGNGSRWREIYGLNQDKIKNPNLIYPGQVLVLP